MGELILCSERMEPESFLFSRTHHPPGDLFEYYLVVCLGKEAPWWKASAIWFVAFPVLLIHTRQCHPEYSGVRENAVRNLGSQMGQGQWLPASVVTPVLTRDSSCSLLFVSKACWGSYSLSGDSWALG